MAYFTFLSKRAFLLNTFMLSCLEVRELISQADRRTSEYIFFFLDICLYYLRPLLLAHATLQPMVWRQYVMEQKAHGSYKTRQQNCISEWLVAQSRYKQGTFQIHTRRIAD
jgi:hypothetical protein